MAKTVFCTYYCLQLACSMKVGHSMRYNCKAQMKRLSNTIRFYPTEVELMLKLSKRNN